MEIEKALNIFKRLQFTEYEWFIKENKYLATRYSTITMDKMQEKLIDFINEQKRENEMLRHLLYTIRNIAREILIYTHGDNGEFGPIKNCTKQEVYSSFVEIRNIVNGQYCFLDNEEAINKKIEECIKRGNNENS